MANDNFARISTGFVHPTLGYRHLFSYADMMSEDQLRELGSEAEFVSVAHYESRRWIVNSAGVASIVPRRGYRVHGVIWRLPEVEMAALDIHLDVPQVFDRYGALAYLPNGRRITAEYYVARNNELGSATPEYLEPILKTGQQFGFPESYLEEISGWCNAPIGSQQRRISLN